MRHQRRARAKGAAAIRNWRGHFSWERIGVANNAVAEDIVILNLRKVTEGIQTLPDVTQNIKAVMSFDPGASSVKPALHRCRITPNVAGILPACYGCISD